MRTHPRRGNGQVILRARQSADWAGFVRDGILEHVGGQMKNAQSTSCIRCGGLSFPRFSLFIDALQPVTLLEALDQVLESRDAGAVCGYLARGTVSGVNIEQKS
jgi:hypothetical protein